METDRVFIAVPCAEQSRYSEFWGAFQGIRKPPHFLFGQYYGGYIATNQNKLAREFLKSDAEYFWLLNDDQLYEPDTLDRLLSHRRDIVVPLCFGHDLPFKPLIWDAHPTIPDQYQYRFPRPHESGLIPIDFCGGGGMLVHRRVLESIQDPWWEVHTAQNGSEPYQTTEDADFCQKVRTQGFHIWCDLDARVGHSTIFHIWPVRHADGSWSASLVRRGEEIHVKI